ncbi:hypothetical protein BDQ17DRAFT_1330274 [Cyathus striatus]|nr:hypothetical protein BDQ17DRAFT_1330274 [Cyathus striatus]
MSSYHEGPWQASLCRPMTVSSFHMVMRRADTAKYLVWLLLTAGQLLPAPNESHLAQQYCRSSGCTYHCGLAGFDKRNMYDIIFVYTSYLANWCLAYATRFSVHGCGKPQNKSGHYQTVALRLSEFGEERDSKSIDQCLIAVKVISILDYIIQALRLPHVLRKLNHLWNEKLSELSYATIMIVIPRIHVF